MKITAAVVPARSAPFELQTLDLTGPLADEVLVRIVASGMCHTDLHARDGYFPNLPYPVVCGHEGAGIVEEVGASVSDLASGDHVVISFPWCGECEPCRAERQSYCVQGRALKSSGRRADGSVPMSRDGGPVYSCFFPAILVRDVCRGAGEGRRQVAPRRAVGVLGPLGCGLQTGAGAVLNVMQPRAGQSIAIYGVGGVGLARADGGEDRRLRSDHRGRPLPDRLKLARELGATHALESRGAETLAEIRKITGGGTHFALETSAVPAVFGSPSMGCAG